MPPARFQQYLTNELTKETVLIKSNDYLTFQSKIERKKEQWAKQNERLEKQMNKEKALQKASEMTAQAKKEIDEYKNILKATLKVNDRVDWEELFDNKPFKDYVPTPKPDYKEFEKNVPKSSVIEVISFFKKRRIKAEEEAKKSYEKAVKEWEEKENQTSEQYAEEKKEYLKNQASHNAKLEKLKNSYEEGEKQGVIDYIKLVLERSKYPASLSSLFPEVNYADNEKILFVDMELPVVENLISTIEYKYNATTQEIAERKMGKKESEEFYNSTLFQITLRTIHEACESDYRNHVDVIVFNGWIDKIDTKTGKQVRNCIISLQVSKDEFNEINLEMIDSKECFRHLKGVTAGSLVNLAPVKPIMTLNTQDNRIIKAKDVIDSVDGNTNLATMDWQEFEVLIRDLIQKEFSHEGCRVEVTRASRDAGVDAIAYDEDPIRGGKYVIQAKRYNNLVPLSAVRDLYGTVHNEGAVKGILVTTSYYGKDALDFVKDKPLTLINGEQLLYMFNKHGYQMKIELTKKQKASSSVSY